MMKVDQINCIIDSAKGTQNRGVFQIDMLEDKLLYCLWDDTAEEKRTEGTIADFQQALLTCNIVHPMDISTCHRILQTQTDGWMVATLEIRIYKGPGDYPKYRVYAISTKDAHGRLITINGVLEGTQNNQATARRLSERAQQDALFRRAVTNKAVLSLSFDFRTGKRLVSDLDVFPAWLPMDTSLKNMAYALFAQTIYPDDQDKLESLFTQALDHDKRIASKPFFCDCKLRDITRQTQAYRWYRVYHSFTENDPDQTVFFVTIMDIHEAKMNEQRMLEQSMYDEATGMLNRCAFENQITSWLQRMKRENAFTQLCSVIIRVENPIEIGNLRGNAYLMEGIGRFSKKLKAFIHPHEVCGKYGLAEFAMVLAVVDKETLDERLKMLGLLCDSQEADNPPMRIRFGYNMADVSATEQDAFFLEKAYQAVISSRHERDQEEIYLNAAHPTISKRHMKQAESLPINYQKDTNCQVFIRTFGHFDVFVDGEAVLFNHPKAKELLALLVDRRGGFVSATEAISCLWEDEPATKTTLARCRKAALHMRSTLARYGIEAIVETINGKRRTVVDQFDCDLRQYLHHGANSASRIVGTYMSEYSWAESSIAIE